MLEAGTGSSIERVGTGVPGLDSVLGGGLPAHQMHLVLGPPGAGKTTLGLQFLREGAALGERVLYVTLAETKVEIEEVARSHGWTLDGVTVWELTPSTEHLRQEQQYSILYPGEVEFGETIDALLKEVEETRPTRLVFDSLAELRLLARDSLRYRNQILALKQFFSGLRCTVMLLDNGEVREQSLESVAHGVIVLDQAIPEYGRVRRRMHIVKVRGTTYRSGHHDFQITTGGIVVHPRLVAAEHRDEAASRAVAKSGVTELDDLLGGGLDHGTSALLMGPAGAGKSTIATQYVAEMARRGERSAVYVFDESRSTFMARASGLGLSLEPSVEQGLVTVEQLDPAQLSPGEFIQRIRAAVEEHEVRLIVLDSINGYLNAMAEEHQVLLQLHELLAYLGQQGVLTILTVAQHGFVGQRLDQPLDASYLADCVIMLRYFEAAGEVRQSISVVKKRTGEHERSIRELRLGPGVHVGEQLREFEGVLTGVPRYLGSGTALLDRET